MKEEIFTSLVRIKGHSTYKVVSVKSSKPVDRKLFIEFSINLVLNNVLIYVTI